MQWGVNFAAAFIPEQYIGVFFQNDFAQLEHIDPLYDFKGGADIPLHDEHLCVWADGSVIRRIYNHLAQATVPIDADIGQKDHLWMETR